MSAGHTRLPQLKPISSSRSTPKDQRQCWRVKHGPTRPRKKPTPMAKYVERDPLIAELQREYKAPAGLISRDQREVELANRVQHLLAQGLSDADITARLLFERYPEAAIEAALDATEPPPPSIASRVSGGRWR